MGKFKRPKGQLCACGCGEYVKPGNKFVWNHHRRNSKHSEETCKKISDSVSGENNPMFGKRHSEEVCKAQSDRISGKNHPFYDRKRPDHSEFMRALGDNHPMRRSEVVAKTTGENHHFYGKKHSEETCKKISESCKMLGESHPSKRPEFRKAQSKRSIENNPMRRPEVIIQFIGNNNPNWQGGIAADPYCDVWLDKDFKESIKERDGHMCQNPDCRKNCGYLLLDIHHIDYNKKNCILLNLITLCKSCNSRANFDRKYWEQFYRNIMIEKYESVYLGAH